VKKNNNTNGEELEGLNNNLFRSFDPDDENWIVGGSKTITGGPTGSPDSPDAWVDMDMIFEETQTQT
jgi:hypothetical protein